MRIAAPAKVNLSLRVLGKRSDGFHDIETLMVRLDLADELEIELTSTPEISIVCEEPGVPADERNLAWRAAAAFREATGRDFGCRIHLTKRVPHGAGLGGGSSDAASVFVALDSLLGTGLGPAELLPLAAGIGSDIPFFLDGRAAWCRGRGELLEPATGIPALDLVLVKPPFPVPTGWAYSAWSPQAEAQSFEAQGVTFFNDLEAPVFGKHLVLPTLKAWLAAQPGVAGAMMSGSGSTVFAVLNEASEGWEERVHAAFGDTFWVARCRTLP